MGGMQCEFPSHGTLCAGELLLPPGAVKPPVILMLHGWGGDMSFGIRPYAERFSQLGLACLLFDYRGWGRSGGEPRRAIVPARQLEDAECAMAHLRTLDCVDASRMMLWGVSYGGGHACVLAARHPELLGAVAQVPMLDGLANTLHTPPSHLARFVALGLADAARSRKPLYAPTTAPPGGFAAMTRDNAHAALARLTQNCPGHENSQAARSFLHVPMYRPVRHLPAIRIPLLIVAGQRDTITPCATALGRAQANPRIEVRMVDANHFEPYFGTCFEQTAEIEADFIMKLTKSPGGGLREGSSGVRPGVKGLITRRRLTSVDEIDSRTVLVDYDEQSIGQRTDRAACADSTARPHQAGAAF